MAPGLKALVIGAGSRPHRLAYNLKTCPEKKLFSQLIKIQRLLATQSTKIFELLRLSLPNLKFFHPENLYTVTPQGVLKFIFNPETLKIASSDIIYSHPWIYPVAEGFQILSGDRIMLDLGVSKLGSNLWFASDVPGVLDAKNQVIPRLLISDYRHVEINSKLYDMTGGMQGKLSALAGLPAGSKAYIFQGRIPNNYSSVGKLNFVGTEIII